MMDEPRHFTGVMAGVAAGVAERLRQVGLRPTRQRIALAHLLLGGPYRHVTAETLHAEALAASVQVSLATIYNTLNQFVEAGLLREVVAAPGRSYFDNNTSDHYHFYIEDSGELLDIPGDQVGLLQLPVPPADMMVARVDVVVRLRRESL